MAPTPEECFKIAEAAEKKGIYIVIGHVLRYAPFYRALKKLLDEGRIGKIMNIMHSEGIGNLHFSHSYVRRSWHSEEESTSMLLAKSCHDFDILQWLVDKEFKYVQSFGHLSHYTKENKPILALKSSKSSILEHVRTVLTGRLLSIKSKQVILLFLIASQE